MRASPGRFRVPLVFILLVSIGNLLPQARSNDSDPVRQHYLAANKFLASGNTEQATVEFKAFLAEALHRVANAEAQIGEVSKAASFFSQALELRNGDPALLNDYAAVRFDQGQMSEAENLLNSAIALNANDPRANLLLGRVFFNEEKYLAAKPHLELAYKNQRADAWFLLAVTDLKIQQLPAAQELFRNVRMTLGDKAATDFRIGVAYYTGDFPDEAIPEFKKAIALDSKALDQHYYLGLAYLGHNPEAGLTKAEPEFRAELALSPRDFRSHYMLGYIALKRNQMKEAEQELARTRQIKPDDINTLLLTAELYTGTNRDAEAEPLLRKAIELTEPSSVKYEVIRAHYMLGRVLQRAGRAQEAAKELAISEQLREQFRAANGATPKERAAATPQESEAAGTKREVSAEERARAEAFIHEMSVPIAEVFNNLGALAANSSECPACVTYFRRAQEWNPSLEGVERNLGRAAFLCKQYEQAIPPLSDYLHLHADDSTVRSALGLSLFETGRYEEVIKVLEPMKAGLESNPRLAKAYNDSLAKLQNR